MTANSIKAFAIELRKRRLECDVFSEDELKDEDLLNAVCDMEANSRNEAVVYCATVVTNLKERRSKIGCFVVAMDSSDFVIGRIPERCVAQDQMYVLLKALQLYGDLRKNLVIYITCSSVADRVNGAIEGKVLDNKDDGVQQIVNMATKIGFHTHLNASEKKLKIVFCASVKCGNNGVRENTPSWWIRRCEYLASHSLHCLDEFEHCRGK